MNLLDRKSLLKQEACKIEQVPLSEDSCVYVRQMSGRERDRFEQSLYKEVKGPKGMEMKKSLEDFRAKLAVATLCDEKGNMLLLPEDVERLSANMTAASLEKIIEVANRLNAISAVDQEKLSKNSEADQNDNSISDSVAN